MMNSTNTLKVISCSGGKLFDVIGIEGDYFAIDTVKGLRKFNRSKFLAINPRLAVSHVNGRVEVDLNLIDLNYCPTITTPPWSPARSVKPYEQLTKFYFDIETSGLDSATDRIFMVGLMNEDGTEVITITDPDEKILLTKTIDILIEKKPHCLIGHNLFNFDVPFLAIRCVINKIAHPFTKAPKTTRITSSLVNGKPIEFTDVYWDETNILDTYHQIAIWDKAAAKLSSYGLKPSVIALGLRDNRRLELSVEQIRECWDSGDLKTIEDYLVFDLEDTKRLADFLLPVVYYQMNYVPNTNFQSLAIASPALKAQKIHQRLLPSIRPTADLQSGYEGGTVELLLPGLHRKVAKIDVSSLYPSVMIRYGICSRKDPQNRFLGVLDFMRSERFRLKKLAKLGDQSANFQQEALKILVNGSYGFFATGGFSFNDFEAAALVTAFGRKILDLMVSVVEGCGGVTIEIDTDGIFFSHDNPETVSKAVADALPSGIEIELEHANYGMYVPKAKSYVLVSPDGKVSVKGLYRNRDRYPLEKEFPIEYIRLYFTQSKDVAEAYYQKIRQSIVDGFMPVEKLAVTRKIRINEKTLVKLNIGNPGERASYWFTKQDRKHSKTGKALPPKPIQTKTDKYWEEHYVNAIDKIYSDIVSTDI